MKTLFALLGIISLTLGILGIFLPLLPTTPFLLLSATLFMHSSPRLYNWLIGHKILGAHILNYQKYRLIPVKVKVVSMLTIWGTILFSIFVVCVGRPYIQLLLFVIAAALSWHILWHKSTLK